MLILDQLTDPIAKGEQLKFSVIQKFLITVADSNIYDSVNHDGNPRQLMHFLHGLTGVVHD